MGLATMHSGLKYLMRSYRPLKGAAAIWVYAALGLGIAAMVILFRFSSRVELTVHKDARKFLAADYQIQARRKPTPEVYAAAKLIGGTDEALALQTDLLASAVLPSGEAITVSLRAIENPRYPFYGTFGLSPQKNVDDLLGPGGYGVFVDASMKERGLKIGETLSIGSIRAKVLAFIEEEPQSVGSAFSIGPRFMVHQRALAASHLADYGAYAFYSLLIKSSMPYVEVQKVLKAHSPEPTWRLISPERANRQTERIVTRLESFLMLIAFAAFVLGGVGLFAIARFQILRNLGDWILFKALGLTRADLLKFSAFWITLVSLVSLTLGFALGAGLESVLASYARHSFDVDLAAIGTFTALPHAVALALGASLVALGLPLLQVVSISPNEAWSASKTKVMDASSKSEVWICGLATSIVIALAYFDVIAKAWLVAILWGVATWLGAMAIRSLSKLFSGRRRTVLKQYPYLWVHRSWSELKVLNYSIAAAVYLMVLVAVIATTLRGQLQIGRSDSAPQAVVLGVLQNQKELMPIPSPTQVKWIPTLQLRVTAIKGKPVIASDYDASGERIEGDEGRGFSLTREYVASARSALEANESIITSWHGSGNLFSDEVVKDGGIRLSLEREFATRLKVVPGDELSVNIAGVELPARVDSLRSVQWFRFQPSFFIVVHPDDLAGAPLNYVGLLSDVTDLKLLQRNIQTQFPNVAVIDAKSVAERLVTLIDRVILAISSLGVFVLIAACWVFVAVMVSRRPAFRQDMYLIRLMGGSAQTLRRLALQHFIFLTVGTGLVSGALAVFSSWLLATLVFDISLSWLAVVYAMLGAIVASLIFGVAGYVISGPYADWRREAQDSAWQPG